MQDRFFCDLVLYLDTRGIRIYVFGSELFAFRFVRMAVRKAVCSVAVQVMRMFEITKENKKALGFPQMTSCGLDHQGFLYVIGSFDFSDQLFKSGLKRKPEFLNILSPLIKERIVFVFPGIDNLDSSVQIGRGTASGEDSVRALND